MRISAEGAETRDVWVRWLQWGALAAYVLLPLFAWNLPDLAGRVVWTVIIAALPLFIVLAGYHRWRVLCPLAWFAQLPARLGRPGTRRASSRLQANYYYLTFALLLGALLLRHAAINGDGRALAAFFVAITAVAMLFGTVFTGKTWCNYVCPVSLVEKIYTEPRNLRASPNSQCAKCTACKPACPDINEENGYWKEILSGSKRFAYFAFPGMVFAFYLYYFLQSGTWDYYFSGAWTNEQGLVGVALRPGNDPHSAGFFFFAPVPRALAALITLLAGALLSFLILVRLEAWLGPRLRRRDENLDAAGVRHVMFSLAAFSGFVTFYAFAGAPTLRLLPAAPQVFQVLVVASATMFLVRRWTRRHAAYSEEIVARQIIRRWPWTDIQPPSDLHEAFLIHTVRSQTQANGYAQLLQIYKDAVREGVASGFVSRAEVQRLESLRNQLQISAADHEKVMAELDEEERARLLDPARQTSAEKRLQLDAYARALQAYLERVGHASAAPDAAVLDHLRDEYAVTEEEHAAVLDQLLAKGQGMAPQVQDALAAVEDAAHTCEFLMANPGAPSFFLADALARRRERAVNSLVRHFVPDPDSDRLRSIRDGLQSLDEQRRDAAVQALGASVASAIGTRLGEARREAARSAAARTNPAELLRLHLGSSDAYVRAGALYLLSELSVVEDDVLTDLARDEHEVVRETAICLLLRSKQLESRDETGLVTFERMLALRSVPLFSGLAPQELAALARAATETSFAPRAPLCSQGEPGDEVFILLSGAVEIYRSDAGRQLLVGREVTGAFIGEMAVLDPAPRAATVLAGEAGARVLCLGGEIFRQVLRANPTVADGVIRALAARLRGAQARPGPVAQAAGANPPN